MADLVGSFISAKVNQAQQERAFQQQKELQQDAQSYNTLMFNMANAYNSPSAQMARFKAAGLNPNLMYGQMANTASAPSMSAGSAPSPTQMQAPSLMETAQLSLLNAQKRNIDADTRQKLSGANLSDTESANIPFEQWLSKENLRIQQSLADSGIEVNDALIDNYNAQTKKLGAEFERIGVDIAIARLEDSFLSKSLDDRVALVKAQLLNTNSQTRLNNAQATRIATLLGQELSNLKAEFAEINARTGLTQQQRSNLAQQKLIDAADNAYLLLAQEYRNNGNFVERNFGVVGSELVHFISHVLRFSVK